MPRLLIAGPPYSGKSTLAELAAQTTGWPILDFDVIYAELSDLPLHERSSGAEGWAEHRQANDLFVARLKALDHGYIIRTAPHKQHRAILRRANRAQVLVLVTPPEVCLARLEEDDRRPRAARERARPAIRQWWAEYEPSSSPEEIALPDGLRGAPPEALGWLGLM